jgi:lipoyl-dependent peroxiredoxin
MATVTREATIVWQGTLMEGSGNLSLKSGTLSDVPVTFSARIEDSQGMTSPEELLAAAEAECYTMVLANMLAQRNTAATRLETTATCSMERGQSGLTITEIHLGVTGQVEGLDAQTFTSLAEDAERSCPVSNALRGNVNVTVAAHLQ